MYCNKCGNEIKQGQIYCNKCGNKINNLYNSFEQNVNYNMNNNSNRKTSAVLPVAIVGGAVFLFLLIVIPFFIIINFIGNDYNFDYLDEQGDISQEQKNTPETKTSVTTSNKGKYQTDIVVDNVYENIKVNNTDDANKLIVKDSVEQKNNNYPQEIINIENDIIKKYSITAVNLKEMDSEFAKELENVIKKIYNDYPKARGYLTNLTLTNLEMSQSDVVALFRPAFLFGTSNTSTTRPWVIKTQIQLNSRYFLNPTRIESTVNASSKAGHFPKNANRYSPVAHELGHYLSFIALLFSKFLRPFVFLIYSSIILNSSKNIFDILSICKSILSSESSFI